MFWDLLKEYMIKFPHYKVSEDMILSLPGGKMIEVFSK